MPKAQNIYTLYHALDAKGVFDANPANTQSGQYYKKQQFPRMVWHPEGEERVTKPAEEYETKSGVKMVGEQREIIYKIVENRKQYERLLADGWHAHPSGALVASGRDTPLVSSPEQIDSLQSQIDLLQQQLRDAKEYEAATSGAKHIRHRAAAEEADRQAELDALDMEPDVDRIDDDAPDIVVPPQRSVAAAKLTAKAS